MEMKERKKTHVKELKPGNMKKLRVSCSGAAAAIVGGGGADTSVECCLLTDKEFQFINIS